MKDKFLDTMQRMGRAFMLPIAILPIAGILLGLGSSMTNSVMIETYGLEFILGPHSPLYALFLIMKAVGSTIFDNLPGICAVGIAIGMARREKEVAALAAAISYMVMNATVNTCLLLSGKLLEDGSIAPGVLGGTIVEVMGMKTLQMGVFGGIVVGLGVAELHNRFHEISLPSMLSFFGGRRFVPIISVVTYIFVGVLMFYIWPYIQQIFFLLGGLVRSTGYLGTLIYGLIKRSLIPFGLHHVFYFPFWHTAVGGSMEISGRLVEGAQNIFFAQLADPETVHFSADACRYFSGEFIFMIFGLPGAALAMYHTAKPENRKKVGGLLLSAVLASILTGITEPIEFTFLFAAPILFVFHVIIAGCAYMVAHLLNIAVGITFSGGLIDLFFFGILQGNGKTDWIRILPVGLVYFALYYFVFRYVILKLDLKTPGREDRESDALLWTEADFVNLHGSFNEIYFEKEEERSELITKALGGRENIRSIDCCATRLRCEIVDKSLIKQDVLIYTGASGFYQMGNGIQIIYGPNVTKIRRYLSRYLEKPDFTKNLTVQEKTEKTKEAPVPEENIIEEVEEEVSSCKVLSPMKGRIIPLCEVPDLIFSAEILGLGCGIIPEEGKVYAPVDGHVTAIFDSDHAICLKGDHGEEILIHVGINTARLHGKGFHRIVEKKGVRVNKGDLIMEFEYDLLRKEGYDLVTPVIVSNVDSYSDMRLLIKGECLAGEELLSLEK